MGAVSRRTCYVKREGSYARCKSAARSFTSNQALGLQIARIAERERNAAVRDHAVAKFRRLTALGAYGEARREQVHAAEQAEREELEDFVLSQHPDHAQWL